MRPIDYVALQGASVLTENGADHLVFLRQTMERRDCDPSSTTVTARDVLLSAASNIESGQPQPDPATATRLRQIADLLVNLDAEVRLRHVELFLKRLLPFRRPPSPETPEP